MVLHIMNRCHFCVAFLSLLLSVRAVVSCQLVASDVGRIEGNILYVDDVPEDRAVGTILTTLNISGCSSNDVTVLETSASFLFDAVSRQLSVAERLQRYSATEGEHTIRLACVCDYASKVTEMRIVVSVTDVDDHSPEFTQTEYRGRVKESALTGTPVETSERIFSRDMDSLNVPVFYEIYGGDTNPDSDFFDIDNITAEVMLKKDAISSGRTYGVLIKATQMDNKDRYGFCLLTLRPVKSAWNPPKFIELTLEVTVVENTPTGSPIAIAAAVDNDPDTIMRFSLNGSATAMKAFAINPTFGEITTRLIMDYEFVDMYTFTAHVTDGEHEDVLPVTVRVLNVNDNNPEFNRPEYEFTAYNRRLGTVGQLQATDADGDTDLTFSILDDFGGFAVNDRGVITIKSAITKPEALQEPVRLTVLVHDSQDQPRQTAASVLVHLRSPHDDSSNADDRSKARDNFYLTIGLCVSAMVTVGGATMCATVYRFTNRKPKMKRSGCSSAGSAKPMQIAVNNLLPGIARIRSVD